MPVSQTTKGLTPRNISTWRCLNGSVPRGSLQGPLTFVVLVGDLTPGCLMHKYVDNTVDTTLAEILTSALLHWCDPTSARILLPHMAPQHNQCTVFTNWINPEMGNPHNVWMHQGCAVQECTVLCRFISIT